MSIYQHSEINILAKDIKNWRESKGFKTDITNIPEKLALIHSEISEALEDIRKHPDPKSGFIDRGFEPHGFQWELADAIIRILDLCASLDIDIAHAIMEKMEFNERRPEKHGKDF